MKRDTNTKKNDLSLTRETPAAQGAKRTPPKRARLNDDLIRRAAGMACASGRQFTIRDIELRGFAARAGRTGYSFQLQYRNPAGKQRLYALTEGDFLENENSGCVADAREAARRLKRRLEREPGFDPLEVKFAARRERRGGKTIADACEAWLKARAAKRSLRCDASMIRRHIIPRLGALRLAALTPERAREFHKAIADEGYLVAANRTIVLLHSIINLVQPDAPNPARGIAELKRERRRKRRLNPAEMKALWRALDAAKDQRIANVIRLLALTGARRGEVLRMEWEQLDLSGGFWARPADMMKAGKADDMLLNRAAVEWLARMKADADPAERFVFPGKDHGLARLRGVWERARRDAGIADATIHDLRRTLASWAISNGVGLYTVSGMLAHASSKTTEDRYAYLADATRRRAIELVGTLVENAVSDGDGQGVLPPPVDAPARPL
jgi:integrase